MSTDQTLVIIVTFCSCMLSGTYESVPGCIEYCVGYYLLLNYSFTHLYPLNKLGIYHLHQHTLRVIDRLAGSHDTLLKRRKLSAEARDQKEADTSANTPAQHEITGQVVEMLEVTPSVQSHCSSQSSEDEDTSSPFDTVVYIMMFHSPSQWYLSFNQVQHWGK